MNKKRLIFSLIIDKDQIQLSRNFSLQQVGDLNWLFNTYHAESILHSIDELVVLNVTKTNDFDVFLQTLQKLAKQCFMPIAAGGQIRKLDQVEKIFHAGADKIILNTALFTDPTLIVNIAKIYGKQSVVASIDYRIIDNNPTLFINNATQKVEMTFEEALTYISKLPIGELYITSVDKDGTGRGYDIPVLKKVETYLNIPIIASGGVGKYEHLFEGALLNRVTGVSTANMFNFIGNGLQKAREHLREQNIPLAYWSYQQLEV